MKVLEESGKSRDPLTSSAAVDWQMSPDSLEPKKIKEKGREKKIPMGFNKLNNSSDSE